VKKKRLLENERQAKAFQCYVSLGWKRTYARVAQTLEIHPRTIERWGRAFNWVQRAASVDARKAKEKNGLDVKCVVRAALATFVDWLEQKQEEGEPACASVAELEKLVKLDLMLSAGEGDEISGKEVILRFAADDPAETEAESQ